MSPGQTASAWYDFACFQLRLQHAQAAQECLRMALSIDPIHARSVLALAAWSLEQRRDLDAAEVLLRTFEQLPSEAADLEMQVQFLVLRGIYAEMADEPEESAEHFARAAEALLHQKDSEACGGDDDMGSVATAFAEAGADAAAANQAIPGTPAPAVIALPEDMKMAPRKGGDCATGVDTDSVWMCGARYFMALCLPGLAAHLLGKEPASNTSSPQFCLHLGRLALVRLGASPIDTPLELHRVDEAEAALGRALGAALDHGQVLDAFAMRGHIAYQRGWWDEALDFFQVYQDWEPSRCTINNTSL